MLVLFNDDEIIVNLFVQWLVDHDIDPHIQSDLICGINAYSDYVKHMLYDMGDVNLAERSDEE